MWVIILNPECILATRNSVGLSEGCSLTYLSNYLCQILSVFLS